MLESSRSIASDIQWMDSRKRVWELLMKSETLLVRSLPLNLFLFFFYPLRKLLMYPFFPFLAFETCPAFDDTQPVTKKPSYQSATTFFRQRLSLTTLYSIWYKIKSIKFVCNDFFKG